ncbi:MAG: DUF523 domain-containing protein [Desulfuromonas sp.]|nr:MAG: DUF523 domain-containing protein [Desulfuromonas sp.]
MTPLLVSACLLGLNTRYNAETKMNRQVLDLLKREDVLPVPVCPEQLAGFSTPRPSCQFSCGTGEQAWHGKATLHNARGEEVTEQFKMGAEQALHIAGLSHCRLALLKERSPSCATHAVHCNNALHPGMGVTAALLQQHGIQLFSEEELDKLAQILGN